MATRSKSFENVREALASYTNPAELEAALFGPQAEDIIKTLQLDSNLEQSRETDAVEFMSALFESFGKQKQLIELAIKIEIDNTEQPDELFRRGNFATSLLFRYLFDTNGIDFLKVTVLPVIQVLVNETLVPLIINLNGTVKPPDVLHNIRTLMVYAEEVMKNLDDGGASIPKNLRLAGHLLHKHLEEKFPGIGNLVPSILFLRFISPVIIQPHLYSLTKHVPSEPRLVVLLALAKLLQGVVNQNNNKLSVSNHADSDTVTSEFLKTHKDAMSNFYRAVVTYPKQVSPDTPDSQSRKKAALNNLFSYLTYTYFPERIVATEVQVADEAVRSSTMKKLTGWRWKLDMSHSVGEIYKCASTTGRGIKISGKMTNTTVKQLVEETRRFKLEEFSALSPLVDPVISETLTSTDDQMAPDLYLKLRIPFPFTSRDFVVRQYVHFGQEASEPSLAEKVDHITGQTYYYSVTRSDKPRCLGLVRGELQMIFSFTQFYEPDDKRPSCAYDFMIVLQPNARLPPWVVKLTMNSLRSGMIEYLRQLKEDHSDDNSLKLSKSRKSPEKGKSPEKEKGTVLFPDSLVIIPQKTSFDDMQRRHISPDPTRRNAIKRRSTETSSGHNSPDPSPHRNRQRKYEESPKGKRVVTKELLAKVDLNMSNSSLTLELSESDDSESTSTSTSNSNSNPSTNSEK